MTVDPKQCRGHVYLIGAGPGDVELLTLKASRLISEADVILYAGSLVNPAVLRFARPEAEIHDTANMKLEDQIAVMSYAAAGGRMVARLHTGDPTIYGAIAEQIRELERLGIPYTVVPGVSSAFAAGAALGIEYTLPGDTQTLILSRMAGRTAVPDREALSHLAAHHTSLVVFLSTGLVADVVIELEAAGYEPDTAVAVVYRATWPDERIILGTLETIATQTQAAEITHQALIVVSPALKNRLSQTTLAAEPQRSHLYGAALDAPVAEDTIGIITLTAGGLETGTRIQEALPGSVLYAPDRLVVGRPCADQLVPYRESIRQVLQNAFAKHSALICVMASGIVVRDLAPMLRDKRKDPGVVVVDEAGHFAISLLGGHVGGANALARQTARILGGQAVITTASDVLQLPALDLLGSEEGWTLESARHLTKTSAAMVNGEPIGVFQEAGSQRWWPDPAPQNLIRFESMADLVATRPQAALLITHHLLPSEMAQAIPSLIYRPPCLAVGIGCNRNTPAVEIEEAVENALNEAGLAAACVACLASIDDKCTEAGLLEFAQARDWPVRFYSHEQIAAIESVSAPSQWAQRALGVPGVAEPAAMLASDGGALLLAKRKHGNVTVSIALISPPAEEA